MTTSELEQVIREYILNIYKKYYIGKIKIKKLNPGYCIYLDMGNPDAPLVICGWLEDDKFLKFLKEDLRNRSFYANAYYGSLMKDYPDQCKPINKACNDKKGITR